MSHPILVTHSSISPATHDLLQAVGGFVDPSEPHITGGVHGGLDGVMDAVLGARSQ